jgi:hypothetical protein
MSQTFLAEPSFSFLNARDVALWHETDMPTAMRDVRSRGQSGKNILAVSLSDFDPQRS